MIELFSQAFVLYGYSRLVPFALQIVAWAAPARPFPLPVAQSPPNRATRLRRGRKNDARNDSDVNHGIGCHITPSFALPIPAWPDGTDSDSDDSTLAIDEARQRQRRLRKALIFRA